MYQVIFQLNEADIHRINLVLNNINNLRADLEKVEIELVAYAQGVVLYLKKDNPHLERLQDLQKKGVQLAVCNNTMRSLDLKPEDLLEEVKVVPSGVGELVRKQKDGWIYIRP